MISKHDAERHLKELDRRMMTRLDTKFSARESITDTLGGQQQAAPGLSTRGPVRNLTDGLWWPWLFRVQSFSDQDG